MWLLNEKYNGEKTEDFFADCARLTAGEPLAYIIGHIPFLDTTIFLDSHPLIPRTETEFWVERALEDIRTHTPRPRVLDLCAGSGCIGVAVLTHIETSHVDFAEIDTRHHGTILRNISENAIPVTRANVYGGDLFERITEQYDFILSNPPYIDPALDRTEQSVTDFEPDIALYGGTKGLAIIAGIITDAPHHLAPGGILYIEHEPEQSEAITHMGELSGLRVATHRDQYNIPRYTVLTRETL